MHLKSLSLRGFKSFATPTTLALEPGIICVVGPNGSGKSNIVDALAWVMGEQGAKTLRGANMADVIFAGTPGRPALGRAEVRLSIDNSSGDLPIDYTEVTISRTLFRQGGSEYAINGTPVRLLDVQELLSDTGMGRSMHVIVGQGQLDQVLRADALERRAFIEEAAGVLKHRRRKERALRKLETLAEKLERLEDVTREIGRQLGPLARQAKIASKAQIIQARERDLRARLLADDVVTQRAGLDTRQESADAINAERAQLGETIARDEQALRALEADHGDDEAQRVAGEQWRALTSLAESLTSLATIAGERARQLSVEVPPPGGASLDERDEAIARLRADVAEIREQAEAAREHVRNAETAARDAGAAEHAADARLAEARQAAQAAQSRRQALAGAATSAASRAEAAAETVENAARASLARTRAADAGAQLGEDDSVADTEAWTEQAAYDEAAAAAQRAAQRRDDARARLAEATQSEATWASRRDALALLLRPAEATGALLGAGLDGLRGVLAPTLTVAPGWEDALGHALGDLVSAVIAEDDAAGEEALEHARRHDLGRVCLVYADSATEPPREATSVARGSGRAISSPPLNPG
nr:AAA family ATPase [Nanchangia anserum]